MISLLPASARNTRPWKNGGGSTQELFAEPPGSGTDDFSWRISVATIDGIGPFSEFAGVDRSLCLLSDAPLQLLVDEVRFRLDTSQPVLRFSGEARVRAEAAAAPHTVLNVMSRRDCFAHTLHRFDGHDGQHVALDAAAAHLLFVRSGACRLQGHPWSLQQYDAALVADETQIVLQTAVPAELILVTITLA
ncbi:HutD family protein [Undibacterium sp.]|uniref:HutD/Ves family protein n=1 Tax=Undibacterium sp. TaxID=1914977 RepID=UPI00374D8256